MNIQITTRGIPATADEWFRALNLPEAELPELADDDKRRARLRHFDDTQYRRHLALRRFASDREAAEAETLQRLLTILLSELGTGYQIAAIEKRGLEQGWHILMECRGGRFGAKTCDVYFGADVLGPDNLGDERRRYLTSECLRPHFFHALGREDALSVAS